MREIVSDVWATAKVVAVIGVAIAALNAIGDRPTQILTCLLFILFVAGGLAYISLRSGIDALWARTKREDVHMDWMEKQMERLSNDLSQANDHIYALRSGRDRKY